MKKGGRRRGSRGLLRQVGCKRNDQLPEGVSNGGWMRTLVAVRGMVPFRRTCRVCREIV